MSDKVVGLVIPTRWEANGVFRRFDFKRIGPRLYSAVISARPVLLCISGVGKEAARLAADRLATEGVKELVSMGFCGALIPALQVGDLVTDRIATVDKPVRTPQERRALTERANAVAADMETQAVIEAGTRRGLPIRVLRVVSDEFDDDLTVLFGSNGGFSAWGIAIHLLNPKAWPLAWSLKKKSRTACARLAEELGRFCSAGA